MTLQARFSSPGASGYSPTRRRFLGIGAAAALLATGRLLAQPSAAGPQRSALVIGNSAYSFGKLRNPVNDANAMRDSLAVTGFQVTPVLDAPLATMLDEMKKFVSTSRASEVRMFFYAGHGVQVKGVNYLVPVDATTLDEDKVGSQLVNVDELVRVLAELKTGVNVVVLDACRTGLTAAVGRRRGGATRSIAPGLAEVPKPPSGTLVAFSAAPGAVAFDGRDDNSAYTKHLARLIATPGLPIESLFKEVRTAVKRETNNAQVPWESNSIDGEFCFRTGTSGRCLQG